jgi:SAM-dependent methyltransferase
MSEEAARDQAAPVPETGRLPFADGSLDLVIDRHESFNPREVARVLAPGGRFVTQQVDFGSDVELYELLGLEPPEEPGSWLPLAVAQLSAAGLDVTVQQAGRAVRHLRDVGALVYYLKIVPWVIPQHRLEEFLPRLRSVSTRRNVWPARLSACRFLVGARRPLA